MNAPNSATFAFSSWPPNLTDAQLFELTSYAATYALSHGLLYLPPHSPSANVQAPAPTPTAAIHAPLSIFPAPFPRQLFEGARKLQRLYNVLYAKIAMDEEFLDQVMGAELGVGRVDDFVGTLWAGWQRVREERHAERRKEQLHLGIFRSDYLLHVNDGGSGSGAGMADLQLKQVEFNTISSSFGALSERVAALHRNLFAATGYYDITPSILSSENFPPNRTTSGLADGLAAAHRTYGKNREAWILFVVQPGERNVFDQRWLEYNLLERHSIHVIRQTFTDLLTSASLDPMTNNLHVTSPTNTHPIEISTIYYRAGYTPTDYFTQEYYTIRFLLEKSNAINCPSIALQLAGGKKVQEVLTRDGVLERFVDSEESYGYPKEDTLRLLRESWMPMWGLDDDDDAEESKSAPSSASQSDPTDPIVRTLANHLNLVLKPQREGGGNNVYKEGIPDFLSELRGDERKAWIAMQLIEPPKGVQGWLVRPGGAYPNGQSTVVKTEVVSELGIFGWALFGRQPRDRHHRDRHHRAQASHTTTSTTSIGGVGRSAKRIKLGNDDDDVGAVGFVAVEGQTPVAVEEWIQQRDDVGWLVRTKGKESNEGGVATGFSVLDSVVLV